MQAEMLIGGKFIKGWGDKDPVVNPRTGATVIDLPRASANQVGDAVAAARKAFPGWSRTTP